MPYPFIHIRADHITNSTTTVPYNSWGRVFSQDFTFNYPVPKDVMIAYSLAIHIDDVNGIVCDHTRCDTIWTACFVDGNPTPAGIITRTPITTQPFINNVLAVNNLAPNVNHTVRIQWFKDTPHGTISLKEANVTIVATENQQ